MKEVTSAHNNTLKHLRQLASSAKHRQRTGQTLLEGVHLCDSYLQHAQRPTRYIYTDNAATNPEVARVIGTCDTMSVPGMLVSERHFRTLSSVEHGVGILFEITVPAETPPAQLNANALLLENIQDPGNMGTILRTAAAAGVTQVYGSAGSASAWSPKVLRAGMGAHFALHVYEQCDLAALIRESEVPVLATSLEATETIYEKDLSRPAAWVFGNEGRGISESLLSLGVNRVIIPQNRDVESLNVAAAVAVCLFEQARQQSK